MNKILLVLLLSLFGLLLVIYFVIQVFNPTQTKKIPPPPIQTAPSASPAPTPRQFMPQSTTSDLKPLQLVSVEPPENLDIDHNPITQIKFTFTDNVDMDNFLLEISPNTQIEITPQSTTHTYTISANDFWPIGLNIFTIKKGTKSQSGSSLQETFVYKINIQYPKNPPPDGDE